MQQKGYYDANVTSEIITVDPALGNAIQIIYTIMRGTKHDVADVLIEGNQYFTEKEIRRRIKTRKEEWFSHGVYSAEILEQDRLAIETMYQNAGIEGTVVTTSAEDIGHAINVLIKIQEGKQPVIDSIAIKGNMEIPEQELRSAFLLRAGGAYTPGSVDQARAQLTQFYYSRGYADAYVERTVDRTGPDGGVRVVFNITEGRPFRI